MAVDYRIVSLLFYGLGERLGPERQLKRGVRDAWQI